MRSCSGAKEGGVGCNGDTAEEGERGEGRRRGGGGEGAEEEEAVWVLGLQFRFKQVTVPCGRFTRFNLIWNQFFSLYITVVLWGWG